MARWTAAQTGSYRVEVTFEGIDDTPTTTDVHVRLNDKALAMSGVHVAGGSNTFTLSRTVEVDEGDKLDFAVGWGNGNYLSDSTAVEAVICRQ